MPTTEMSIAINRFDSENTPSEAVLREIVTLFAGNFPDKHYIGDGKPALMSKYATVKGLMFGIEQGRKWYCLVDEEAKKMIAMLCLGCKSGRQNHIRQIVVESDHQGKGLAKLLVERVQETCEGGSWMTASIQPTNEASLALFERLGYTPMSHVEGKEHGLVLNPEMPTHALRLT